MSSSTGLPSLFVGHGAPTLAVEPGPTQNFLKGLGAELARPEAVLCVSAHWETARPTVGAAPRPESIRALDTSEVVLAGLP
ncbi:MAG: hypothetical protein IH999_07235 [Proteobacteria bacterium]|nr:hypothetical protein [Pseudomonadota bacterium]